MTFRREGICKDLYSETTVAGGGRGEEHSENSVNDTLLK